MKPPKPNDIAERRFIGSILRESRRVEEWGHVIPKIQDPRRRRLGELIAAAVEDGKAVTILDAHDLFAGDPEAAALRREIESCDSSGDGYMSPKPVEIADFARGIEEAADRIEGYELGLRISAEARTPGGNWREIITGAEKDDQAPTLRAVLDSTRFQADHAPAKPEAIFRVAGCSAYTPGNISAIVGPPKSAKTAVLTAHFASVMRSGGDTLGIESSNPKEKAVIHFDTEQSPFDHHSICGVALRRARLITEPAWFRSYSVVSVPMADRLRLLKYELRRASRDHGGIHSVFLDGVADFIAEGHRSQNAAIVQPPPWPWRS